MSLNSEQFEFSRDVSLLILWAQAEGYDISLGEAFRTKEQSQLNEDAGVGIANSNHTRRLAVDLNLFMDGTYLTETEDHRPLGEYWQTLHPANVWGGDFQRRDGNHYSRRYKDYPV